ncbi:hypothetical protein J6590_045756 [Homalodisca vitripennis]|nr:hypothetical protein J6590_045756 [Homalodisca vitripennis]
MGNTAQGRRNSMLPKQESSSSDTTAAKGGKNSRQNTLQEEEDCVTELQGGGGGGNDGGESEALTERQKELLTESWKVVEGDIAKVGVITFISLFETHPDVQQVFLPFNGLPIDELKHSKQLRAHALRYANTLNALMSSSICSNLCFGGDVSTETHTSMSLAS